MTTFSSKPLRGFVKSAVQVCMFLLKACWLVNQIEAKLGKLLDCGESHIKVRYLVRRSQANNQQGTFVNA